MYNVTDNYKTLIKAPVRYVGISGAVRLNSGELIALSDSNIAEGSLKIIRKLNQRGGFSTRRRVFLGAVRWAERRSAANLRP